MPSGSVGMTRTPAWAKATLLVGLLGLSAVASISAATASPTVSPAPSGRCGVTLNLSAGQLYKCAKYNDQFEIRLISVKAAIHAGGPVAKFRLGHGFSGPRIILGINQTWTTNLTHGRTQSVTLDAVSIAPMYAVVTLTRS